MRYLFSRGHEALLASLFAQRPLLAFDFDGTLAPLVERPADAQMDPPTHDRLARLAERAPVVIISGRALSDLTSRFDGVRLAGVSANHGLEPWGATLEIEERVQGWAAALEKEFSRLPGIEIQNKRWSLTVDYRHVPDLEQSERSLCAFARTLPGVRLLGGRHADLNLAPAGPHNKGTALKRHLTDLGCGAALYVGDDRTDEDVFSLDMRDLMSVRVGHKWGTHARYFLRSQGEITRLLDDLLTLASGARR